MKKLSLLLACSSTLLAQTYPGGIYTPLIAVNNVQTTLTAPMAAIDTVAIVAASAGWVNNSLAYICDSTTSTIKCTGTFEIMKVTNVAGNVLTVTRGLGGTSAIAHASGKAILNSPVALYNKTVNDEVFAIETALGANMANIPGSPSGGVVPVVKGGTGVTTAQGNGSKVQLSTGAAGTNNCVKFDANGNTVDSGLPCNTLPSATAQLQQLRVKPNTGNLTTDEFADPTLVNAKDYNYTAQQPGGSLTGAVGASVTLTPCPLGVIGTDTRLRFWIAGTGTPESVASTGAGTCVSGGATGTVTFTPAGNHANGYTISSSNAGIYEAIAANPSREIHLPAGGTYTMHDCLNLNPNQSLILTGDGSETSGSFMNFGTVTSGCSAISLDAVSITNNAFKIFRHFNIQGTGTASGGSGFYLHNTVRVIFDDVTVNLFAGTGINMVNAFEITVFGCQIGYSGGFGISMSGISNLNRVIQSYIGNNSRNDGNGGIAIVGTSIGSPTTNILLDGVDIEGQGSMPFTSVTTTYGLFLQNISGLTFVNSYIEGNVGTNAVLYQGSVTGVVETSNWFNGGHLTYANGTINVRSNGNTFFGAAAYRSLPADISTFALGYDTCFSGSTECTTHPNLVGNIVLNTYTFATLPAATNGTPIYCSNCNATCTAGGGTGRTCFRENGAWTH